MGLKTETRPAVARPGRVQRNLALVSDISRVRRNILFSILVAIGAGMAAFLLIGPLIIQFPPEAIQESLLNYLLGLPLVTLVLLIWAYRYLQPVARLAECLRTGQSPSAELAQQARTVAFNIPFSLFVIVLVSTIVTAILIDLVGLLIDPNYALIVHVSETVLIIVLTTSLSLIVSIVARRLVRPVLFATADLAQDRGRRYEIRLRIVVVTFSLGLTIYLFLGILALNLVYQQAADAVEAKAKQWTQDVAMAAPELDRATLLGLIREADMARQYDVFVIEDETNQLILSPPSSEGQRVAQRALSDREQGIEVVNERYTRLTRLERPDGAWWLGVTYDLPPFEIPNFGRAVLILLGFGLVMCGLTVAFAWYMTQDITRDLGYVTSRLLDIARQGKVGQTVHTLSLDEVGDLVTAFNEVQDVVAAQQDELARHQQRLLALRDISQQISAVIDSDQLWPTLFREVAQQLGYQQVSVYLLDETGHQLYRAAATHPAPDGPNLQIDLGDPALSQPPDEPVTLAGHVALTQEPLVVPDVSQSSFHLCGDAQSGLAVPMGIGERRIGVFCVQSKEADAFTPQDVQVLVALAKQVATTFENTRLFRQIKQHAKEVSSLYEASLTLSSLTDFKQVVDHICQIVHDSTRSDGVRFFLYEPHPQDGFDLVGQFGHAVDGLASDSGPGDELRRSVLQSGQPMLIPDTRHDPVVSKQIVEAGVRSLIVAPVISRQKGIGVLSVSSHQVATYTQNDVQVVLALASQAAIAIENARLLEKAKTNAQTMARRARNLLMINRISTTLASSLNAAEIFGEATQHLVELMDNVHHSSVLIFEPNAQYGQIVAEYPDLGATKERIPIDDNPTVERVIATRKPLIVSDVANDPVVEAVRPELQSLNIHSLLIMPLIGRGQVIGSIGLDVIGQTHQFAEEEIDLCQTIASQAAIAASNARLLYDLRQQSRALTRKSLELAEESSKLDAVLRNIVDGLVVIDLNGRIMLSNPAFKRLVDVSPGQLLRGRLLSQVFTEADLGSVIDEAKAQPESVASADLTLPDRRVIRATATALRLSPVPEMGEEGQIAGIITVLRDITHQVEVDRMKTDFVSAVSHELRTPLTAILGFASLIRREFRRRIAPFVASDATARRSADRILENLNIIESESQRLTRLINDVLDIAKMEAGRIDWHMTKIDLLEVAQASMSATEVMATEKELPIILRLSSDLPKVWGDRDRLTQVITNLLSNAIKFTDEGRVIVAGFQVSGSGEIGPCPLWSQPSAEVKAQIERLIQQDKGKHPQGWAVVAVADTGTGIAAQDLPLVFARFGQVGDSLTGKPKGTGLGLSICKEIVEHHGGQIWLESEWGVGSTFYFAVPIVGADQAAKKAPADGTLAGERGRSSLLLVVDDEPNICQWLCQELSEAGYRVIEACDGASGLGQVRQSQPDLLILDLNLPDMTGYDVVERLRSEPETARIPIVMLSVTEAADRSRQVGAQAFIQKPVNVPHLLKTVSRLLSTPEVGVEADEPKGEQGP